MKKDKCILLLNLNLSSKFTVFLFLLLIILILLKLNLLLTAEVLSFSLFLSSVFTVLNLFIVSLI